MSLGMKMLNLNERFARSKFHNIIQDVFRRDKANFKDALYDILPSGSQLESYPQCFCGCTKYEPFLGEICDKCGHEVKHRSEERLENLFHIAKPAGIDKFLNPKVYMDLIELCKVSRKAHSSKSFNPIHFLTIDNYKPATKDKTDNEVYRAMLAWDVPRNWNYFVANIRTLVPRIFDLLIDISKSRKFDFEMKAMLDLLNYEDDVVFCDVLPVINKLILAIEQTGDIKRKSPTTEKYGIAITDLISLPTEEDVKMGRASVDAKALKRACNVVGKAYRGLDQYFEETMQREGKKGGLCRSDTLGLRSPFTWRAVITQICEPHRGDELHMPWTASTYLLEPYILNIMAEEPVEQGGEILTPDEALDYLAHHRRVFSPWLHEVMTRIIYSFTDKGLPSYHIRYPTLYQQSGQLQYISKIKTDPEDRTASVSALSLPGQNGD